MDPGFDDAMALCLALAEPNLEVVAVTATGGNVPPEQATRNVQALVEFLDPPRWPRIGAASPGQILRADARHIHGNNGLSDVEFPVAELHHRHPSIKVISDAVRAAPSEVTIIATGPLSNIAAVLRSEPDLAAQIGHLIILGGTLTGPGNITAAAEFNVYCDAESAREVFHSHVTKTVIPVDLTRQLIFNYGFLDKLPNESSRPGALLRKILPGAFRVYHERLGLEGIYAHDPVAIVAAVHPELFTTQQLWGDVETEGVLTHGATIFDRRHRPENQPNMDVTVEMDCSGVMDCILRVLTRRG